MKRFRFLLLDAGPIIKLFELGIWDEFITRCDVTVCKTVAGEASWASRDQQDVPIDLETYERDGRIRIADIDLAIIRGFYDRFDLSYQAGLHDGEKETLAFLCSESDPWIVCAADGAVFRTLGALDKGEQGISLEEVLTQIGLGRTLEWKYSERFCRKYTRLGQEDAIRGQGLR